LPPAALRTPRRTELWGGGAGSGHRGPASPHWALVEAGWGRRLVGEGARSRRRRLWGRGGRLNLPNLVATEGGEGGGDLTGRRQIRRPRALLHREGETAAGRRRPAPDPATSSAVAGPRGHHLICAAGARDRRRGPRPMQLPSAVGARCRRCGSPDAATGRLRRRGPRRPGRKFEGERRQLRCRKLQYSPRMSNERGVSAK
jgi:hypothetical protein